MSIFINLRLYSKLIVRSFRIRYKILIILDNKWLIYRNDLIANFSSFFILFKKIEVDATGTAGGSKF